MESHIQIKLYATLARFRPEESDRYAVPADATVADLIARLDLPRKEVKLVFVNGRKVDSGKRLGNGDRVGIFPPVGGG